MTIDTTFGTTNPLGTLRSLRAAGFTVFENETFEFAEGLNVIIGENGAGKSHLMKLAYAASKALYPERPGRTVGGKEALQKLLANKLNDVFLPDSLGRLCRRAQGRQRAEVELDFTPPDRDDEDEDIDETENRLAFSFASNSSSTVVLETLPESLPESPEGGPIFLPAREVLSLTPELVGDWNRINIRFDQTYLDLARALLGSVRPGKRPDAVNDLVRPLEEAMGGTIYTDKGSGRFYLRTDNGNLEMPLVAEGLRKVAMLAYLILNGTLARHGTIYWDEPEANLNPRLLSGLTDVLVRLAASGVQVFVATHSLFLMRELALKLRARASHQTVPARFFSLVRQDGAVSVESADDIDDLETIASLDATIDQDGALERQSWERLDD